MNNTPVANRKKVVLVGNRNAGKSTIFNLLLSEERSIVSDSAGTTTDPVSKAMELVDFGPISLVDTAGLDDVGELGQKRVEKSNKEILTADLIVHVISIEELFDDEINELYELLHEEVKTVENQVYNESMISMLGLFVKKFEEKYEEITRKYSSSNKKFVLVFNKLDLLNIDTNLLHFEISGWLNELRDEFLEKYDNIAFLDASDIELSKSSLEIHLESELSSLSREIGLLEGLVEEGNHVLLVVPIDSEAPAGRLILPQSQVIRDALDRGVFIIIVRDVELELYIKNVNPKLDLVIIDSKIFGSVEHLIPEGTRLTSFSIIFARQKGDLDEFVLGANSIMKLNDGDKILISESCSHTTNHEDIGKYKIPALLRKKTGAELEFDFSNGRDFPQDLSEYSLVVQCGGCMTTRNDIMQRIETARKNNVPITNYGILFSYLNGSLERSKI